MLGTGTLVQAGAGHAAIAPTGQPSRQNSRSSLRELYWPYSVCSPLKDFCSTGKDAMEGRRGMCLVGQHIDGQALD